MTRRILIAGNWKMNGSVEMAASLLDGIKSGDVPENADLLVCPPFPYLGWAAKLLDGSNVSVGGQSCHANVSGAHTGDVAAEMLADIGCKYVIVGHSERRTDHAETDEIIRAQAEAAHRAGLIAIVCVGETEAERDAGTALDVVNGQLAGSVPNGATAENTVIAYEPVWAIGTGKTATPEDAQEVHAAMRATLKDRFGAGTADAMHLLYGGSMKPGNAPDLLAKDDIDGGLIGGASLNAEDFLGIAAAAG